MTTHVLKSIRLEELKDHPENPRKYFDEAALAELTENVRAEGVLNPLLVRPNSHGFEILAGARRFRAAQRAGLQEVPALVRELDDQAALKLVIIDNLQREDLHPLEEAAGYASLMKSAGFDVDQIATRISKSSKYVYDRIKLLQLIPELRKIFIEGEITAGHAILCARLDPAQQKRLLAKDRLAYGPDSLLFVHEASHDAPGFDLNDRRRRKAVSVRELETHIDNHFRFDPSKADLQNLFPETAEVLAAGKAEDLKTVFITYDYRAPDATRDEKQKTYGVGRWKRADGQVDHGDHGDRKKGAASKVCEHRVVGIVAGGPGRGSGFFVCVAHKKCKVHWAAEIKASEKRASEGGSAGSSSPAKAKAEKKPSWQVAQEKRAAEAARWTKAAPQLEKAWTEALKTADALTLFDVIMDEYTYSDEKRCKQVRAAATLEARVRIAATFITLDFNYPQPDQISDMLEIVGIDAKKIVDEACPPAPKVKPEKAKAATKKKAAKP